MRRLTMKEWCLISDGLSLGIKWLKKMKKKQTNPAYKEAYAADIKRSKELIKLVDAGWLAMQEEGDNL